MNSVGKILLSAIVLSLALLFYRELEQLQEIVSTPRSVTVYVTGAVKEQRTITLPAEARRIHAINLCGGVTADADMATVNPAQRLEDGETVLVARKVVAPPTAQVTEPSSSKKINLNTATMAELQSLPGVGPVTARRIIQYRRKSSFTTLEDLAAIRGIRRKTMVRLRPFLELEGL